MAKDTVTKISGRMTLGFFFTLISNTYYKRTLKEGIHGKKKSIIVQLYILKPYFFKSTTDVYFLFQSFQVYVQNNDVYIIETNKHQQRPSPFIE